MCGKRFKYLRNGFTMLEMTQEFDKRLIYVDIRFKYVGNDAYVWEMA